MEVGSSSGAGRDPQSFRRVTHADQTEYSGKYLTIILPARAAALQIFSWAIVSLEQTFIAEPRERAKGKFHLVFAGQLGMADRGRMDRPPFLRGRRIYRVKLPRERSAC